VNASVKAPCLAAGVIAGAGSIDDMDLLRHGAMLALFGGIRAPSTLGSFLRPFTWGNVPQLENVSRVLLADLARRAPLPGKDTVAFVDIDSMQEARLRMPEARRGVRPCQDPGGKPAAGQLEKPDRTQSGRGPLSDGGAPWSTSSR
jgi:hypothetical protein